MLEVNKRIMFITGSLTDGGAERVISILASNCAEMGTDVSLVIMREQEHTYRLSDKVKCVQMRTGKSGIKVLDRVLQLHRIIKQSDADVLIPFLPIISLYTLIANLGIGKKIIMSERADPNVNIFEKGHSIKDIMGHVLMRKLGLFNCADWMVFQTPDAQAYYGKKMKKKSSIIPNPLDIQYLPERFMGEREKRIVAVGRFSEEKNFEMLIRGFAEFHREYADYKLVIYGEGELRSRFESIIQELGIKNNVGLPGFVKDLPEKIVSAAMYVSTSNHEGISNSMLEALGMGIPTIVTDCPIGGARMFVKTDENGILIPMNNNDSLVSAMKKIAGNDEYARKISKNATILRQTLTPDKICKQWLEVIHED